MVVHVLILIVVLVCFYNFHYKRQILPPGPIPLPILGNLLSLVDAKNHIATLLRWRKEFGSVYTIWIGEEPIITVNDVKTAERWFVNEGNAFCDRYMNEYVLQKARSNYAGILSTSGMLWKEHRRFALKSFRECLGQTGMQDLIMTEVCCLIDKLHIDNGAGLVEHDFCRHLELSTSSVIGSVVFGQRFTVDNREAEFDELKKLSRALMKLVTDPIKLGLINNQFTRKIPFLKHLSAELIQVFTDINQVIDRKIDEYIKCATPNKCYVEAFLREQSELDQNKKAHTYNRLQLRANCLDLFIAGQETTASSLQWVFAFLVLNQDVQQKVHEELDRVVGKGQKVFVSHRTELPYLGAVIVEAQRCANILLQNLIRRATRDITIDGFFLRKGQAVLPQISTMLWDPTLFPEPETFRPDRFVDANGRLVNTELVTPFSLGKRQCLGEGLARMELYLFTANLLSQFKLLPAKEPPRLERQNNGTASTILPYLVKVEPRC